MPAPAILGTLNRSHWLAHDTMTESNGVLLTAHTPEVGGPWAALTGNFASTSGEFVASPVAEARVIIDTGVADVLAVGDVRRAGGVPCVAARWVDGSNGWFLSRESATCVLYEVTAGTITSRGSTSVANNTVEGFRLYMRVSSSSIACFARNLGTGVLTTCTAYTSSQHATATKHGVRSNGNANAKILGFDCYRATQLIQPEGL